MKELIKCIIVDDETNSRVVIRTWLERYFPDVEILGEASDAEIAYDLITEKKPNLIFLDIQMPRGDGFSLLKRFTTVPFEVIFVTSFNQYALSAIKFNALDYLLKPLDIDDLKIALEKAAVRIANATARENDTRIFHLLQNVEEKSESRKVTVHTNNAVIVIDPTEIVCICAESNYSIIVLDNGERHTTARTLRDFEEFFGEKSSLLRIDKSLIINAKKIKKYTKGEPFIVELTNGETHEVARRRKSAVLSRIQG